MSEQKTVPRWQDVPEEWRGAVRQAMSLIRDEAPPANKVRPAIDAALERLVEPETDAGAWRARFERLASKVKAYVPYVLATIGDPAPIDGRPDWVACHRGRCVSSHRQLEAVLAIASEPAPSAPTAAERWRAVPADAKADAYKIVKGEIRNCDGGPFCPECDALDALVALAREAEGGGR